MFTARPNALQSAIAVALSSFVLPVSKAAEDLKIKLTGPSQSQGGQEHIRHMTLKFGDQLTDKVVAQFDDETTNAQSLQFFSNHLHKYDSQLTVETQQHGESAASYTSTVQINENSVIALNHELATGELTLSVNPSLLGDSGQLIKNLQELLEPEVLDPVTGVATPETFKQLLSAIKTFSTTTPLEEGEALTNVASFKITPIKTEGMPFLRQKLFGQSVSQLEPSALLRGTAWLFPDPEQALAMMTTGLISLFLPEDGSQHPDPAQPALKFENSAQKAIAKLVETRQPVSVVMGEQTKKKQTLMVTPLHLPIIKLGKKAGELVLTADQVSPSAVAWVKTLSGTTAPAFDSLKIKIADVPDLLEAVYQEQIKIIELYKKDLSRIPQQDIQRLSHLTKQAVLISFVQTNGYDTSFSPEMIKAVASPLEAVGLFSRLLYQFANHATVSEQPNKAKFLAHLSKQLVTQSQPEIDDSNRAVYFHDLQTALEAWSHCQVQHQQALAKSQTVVNAYSLKMTMLSSQMQSYMDEEALTNYIPEVELGELTKIMEDEDGYKKIQALASKHHNADAHTLKKRWVTTQLLAKQLRDQLVDQPEERVKALVRHYSSLEKFLDEGAIKEGEADNFQKALHEIGFPPDEYADIVVKVIHDLAADQIEGTYKDVKNHLMEVDFEAISDEAISIAQTGTTIETVNKIHEYEQKHPGVLEAKRNSLKIRQWLANLKTPDDLPSEGALELLTGQPAPSKPMHELLQESWQILPKGSLTSSTARQELSRKLLTFTTLMQHLAEEHHQAELLNTIKSNYPELVQLVRTHDPSVVITVHGLFEHKLARLKLTDYKEQIQAVVTELGEDEFTALQDSYAKVLKPLHKKGLLAPEALELGLFEPDQLEIARKALQRQPAHLTETRQRLQNVKAVIQQSNTQLLDLVQKVSVQMSIPATDQLNLLPRARGYATLQETQAIKTFIESYASNEAFPELQPESAFNIIRSFVVLLSLVQGNKEEFVTTKLASQWDNLQSMLQANGEFVPDQEEQFKLKVAELTLDENNLVNVQALAKLVSALNFAEQAAMVQIYNLLKTLIESTDVLGITAPKVLQVMMNMSAEDITNCRLLHQSSPDYYVNLVDARARIKGVEALAEILDLDPAAEEVFTQIGEKISKLQDTLKTMTQQLEEGKLLDADEQLLRQRAELESQLQAVNDFFDGLDDEHFKSVKDKTTLADKIQQFQQEIKTLEASVAQLTEDYLAKNEELVQTNEMLERKTAEFEKAIQDQAETAGKLQETVDETKSIIKQFKEVLKKEGTDQELDNPVDALRNLKAEAAAKTSEVEELTIKVKELEAKQVSDNEAVALQNVKKELQTKTQSLKELHELNEKIQKSVTTYGKTFQGTLEEQVAAMLEDATATKEQLERSIQNLQNAQAEIENLLPPAKGISPASGQKDTSSLTERVRGMLEEFQEAKSQTEALKAEVEDKTAEASKLQSELLGKQKEMVALALNFDEITSALTESDGICGSINAHVEKLITEHRIPVDDTDLLETKVTKSFNYMGELETNLETANKELKALQSFQRNVESLLPPLEPSSPEGAKKVPATIDRIAMLVEQAATLKGDIEALRAPYKPGAAVQEASELTQELKQKNQELKKAQQTLTALTTDFDSLEAQIGITKPHDSLVGRFDEIAQRHLDKQQEVHELTNQLQQQTAIIEEIKTKLPPTNGQPAATESIPEQVKGLADAQEQLKRGLQEAHKQLLATKGDAEALATDFNQKEQEAEALAKELDKLKTTYQQHQKIIKDVESEVDAFEKVYKCNPEEEKDLATRVDYMANHASSEIDALEAERQAKKKLETELGSVKHTLDTLVPDEPPAVATDDARQQPTDSGQPKSVVDKLGIFSQKYKELQTQIEILQGQVKILTSKPDADSSKNIATLTQQLSAATRERDQLAAKLNQAKVKLDIFEERHPSEYPIDQDDLEARAKYAIDTADAYVNELEENDMEIRALVNIRDYYEVLKQCKAPVPSDHLSDRLPEHELYKQIVPIAAKFNLLPPDQLAYAFNQVHLLVTEIHNQGNGDAIIANLEDNLPTVTSFFDPWTGVVNEPAYAQFLKDNGIPDDLDLVVRKAFLTIYVPLLQALFKPAVALYQEGMKQTNPTSVSNWSLAKTQLPYDQLQTLRDAGGNLPDYDQLISFMESIIWLATVTDHLPDDDTLDQLPAIRQLPAYGDYIQLKEFADRHMDVPEAGIPELTFKLETFVSLVKVLPENTMISYDTFKNLLIAARGMPSAEGDLTALAVKLNIPDSVDLLQKAVLNAADFQEFDTLFTDAIFLTPIVEANHVTQKSLTMVYRDFTPHTVRMTRLALHSSNADFQERRASIARQAQFHQALKLINTPEMSALLSGDDTAGIFHDLMQPHSEGMQVLQNVKASFPGAGTEQPVAVHQGLLAISLIITGNNAVDDPVITGFKNAFTEAKATFNHDGTITNIAPLRTLLAYHKIDAYEKAALSIYSSPVTEATFDAYVTHAKAIVKHFGKMVSFATLQAVYQDWQPEHFAYARTLVEAHPQLRDIARKASLLSGMANMEEEAQIFEQASTNLERISQKLATLDQDTLERQVHLSKVMPGFQERGKAVVLTQAHDGEDGDKNVNTVLKKVWDATTLQEMKDAIETFEELDQVYAAVDAHPRLISLHEQFQEFPGKDEIDAMDKAELGPVHDAAKAYKADFSGNGIRSQRILEPVITPLTKDLKTLSLQEITQTYRLLFPDETVKPAEAEAAPATPVPHPAIANCEIHNKILPLYDFWNDPDPDQLEDMKALVKEMAAEDWQPKLQLWTGVTNGKETSAPRKMQAAFHLAKNVEDESAFQRNLNSLFDPNQQNAQPIIKSINLGNELVRFVTEIRKLEPHVKTYEKFVASKTRDALLRLPTLAVTYKNNLPKPLVDAIPAKGQVPEAPKEIRETVETIFALKQELEQLEDLNAAAKRLELLYGDITEELDTGDDYNQVFVHVYQAATEEMDEFCAQCQKGIVGSRVGTDHFKGLHTDGKLNQHKLERTITELDDEAKLAKSAQTEIQGILEGGHGSLGSTLDSFGRVKPLTDEFFGALTPHVIKADAAPGSAKKVINAVSALRKIHAVNPAAAAGIQEIMGHEDPQVAPFAEAINTAAIPPEEYNALLSTSVDDINSLLDDRFTINDLIASDDPVYKLKTSKKIAAKLKEERLQSITLQETLTILNELGDYSEREAALLMKKLSTEKPGLALDAAPRSAEGLSDKIIEAYGDEISEDNALRIAELIFHGTTINDNSWLKVSRVVAKLPDATPEMFAGATEQLITYTEELSGALLKMNTAFQKFFASQTLVQKMVGAVHTYQVSLDDLQALRDYTPVQPLPKVANYLGMSRAEAELFADYGPVPDEIWDSVIKHLAKDPDQFNKYYAVKQTGLNAVNMGYRFLTEFILDDFNLYGGTGVMSLLTGYGDRLLELMGYSREDVARETVRLIQKRWSDPEFQKGMAQTIVPFTSGYQVYRVLDDIKSFMRSPDASAASGAGWSLVFLALTWTNDLAWGAPLTKRMALAFRGSDQVVNIQMALERRIKRTKAQWQNGDISQEQMLKDVARDRDAIRALDEDGPDFQEKALAIVDTLKGDMESEDIAYYKQHIENPFAYRNAKRTFEEKAAAIGDILAPFRPVTNFFGSSLPKWWVARAVADPMVRYGVNRVLIPAAAKTTEAVAPSLAGRAVGSAAYYAGRLLSGMAHYSGAKMAASSAGKLASGAAYYSGASWFVNTMPAWLTGTMTISAIHTAYDCFYYNCEGTRQTWAETYNFFAGSTTQPISDDEGRKQGMVPDAPSTTAASYYSLSAPKNIWSAFSDTIEDSVYGITGWFGSKIDGYMGVGSRSPHSFEAMFTPGPDHRHVSSAVFGYNETNFIPVLEPYHYVYDHVYNHPKPTYFMDNEALFNSTDGSVNLELSPEELAAIKDKGLTSGNIPLKPMKPPKILPPKVSSQQKPLRRSQVIGRHRIR